MTQNPASRCARRVVADIVNAGASPTSVARTLKRDPGSGYALSCSFTSAVDEREIAEAGFWILDVGVYS